ncbi:MAG: hypothetical protein GXY38_09520 [Planctomycetes bacterium]|jgi:hypothetical protein|nr:hypothetical protein [Planctomycetota bacterium]
MKITSLIKWLLGLGLFAVLVMAGAVYLMACKAPSQYRPELLDAPAREAAAKRFAKKTLEEFGNQAQGSESFSISFSQQEINEYFASVDEIAAQAPNGRSGQVRQLLADAGISAPMVVLNDGLMTMMVHLDEHEKILSVDIGMVQEDDGRLRLSLCGARIGDLPVPAGMAQDGLERIRHGLDQAGAMDEPAQRLTIEHVARGLATAVRAIGRDPIDLSLPLRINGRGVRISRIVLAPEQLTLRFVPFEAGE